jgi:hypothetical protein
MRILAPILSTILIFLAPGLVLAQVGQVKCIGCMPIPSIAQLAIKTTPTAEAAPAAPAPVPVIALPSDSHSQAARDIYNVMNHYGFTRVCKQFATQDKLGPWGEYIVKTLNPTSHPQLLSGRNDVRKYCPAFPTMDDTEKKNFYVLLLAFMGFAETTCDPTIEKVALKGRMGVGLMTFHKYHEPDYTPDPFYLNKCRKGDGQKVSTTLTCTLAMLEGKVVRDVLFSRVAYWAILKPITTELKEVRVLNPKTGKRKKVIYNVHALLKEALKLYAPCRM